MLRSERDQHLALSVVNECGLEMEDDLEEQETGDRANRTHGRTEADDRVVSL